MAVLQLDLRSGVASDICVDAMFIAYTDGASAVHRASYPRHRIDPFKISIDVSYCKRLQLKYVCYRILSRRSCWSGTVAFLSGILKTAMTC